tara:strand:+ start:1065 stop:1775 length:711 start_codon:yes stop_codon:yes gene_type:complete
MFAKRLFPVPAFLSAAAGWCLIASPSGAEEISIACLSFPKKAPASIELLVGPGKTIPITLQSHTLTEPVKVPRLQSWRFGKSGTNAAGEFAFKTYGQVKPGAPRNQLLVIVLKGSSPAAGLDILSLDGSPKSFGPSQMLFVNLAREQVAGLVGGKQFRLNSGKHAIIKPRADRGKNLCFASLKYKRATKWRTFFSTNWPTLEKARGLVFLYNDPRSQSVKMHSVVDSLIRVPVPEQ